MKGWQIMALYVVGTIIIFLVSIHISTNRTANVVSEQEKTLDSLRTEVLRKHPYAILADTFHLRLSATTASKQIFINNLDVIMFDTYANDVKIKGELFETHTSSAFYFDMPTIVTSEVNPNILLRTNYIFVVKVDSFSVKEEKLRGRLLDWVEIPKK
jgi:hypothetical protein